MSLRHSDIKINSKLRCICVVGIYEFLRSSLSVVNDIEVIINKSILYYYYKDESD